MAGGKERREGVKGEVKISEGRKDFNKDEREGREDGNYVMGEERMGRGYGGRMGGRDLKGEIKGD